MKLNEIKNVLDFKQILESSSAQSQDLLIESATEMVRQLRTTLQSGESPQDAFGDDWGNERVAQFCASLEKIEKVVTRQLAANKLDQNLRNTVYAILSTSDFDHATNIQKIIKQSHDQQHQVEQWQGILDSDNKQKIVSEMDRLARDLSSLVQLLRNKGAQLPQQGNPQQQNNLQPQIN